MLVAVNLDVRGAREARLRLPLEPLGIGPDEPFRVVDLLHGAEHAARGAEYRVRLDPDAEPAFLFAIRRR